MSEGSGGKRKRLGEEFWRRTLKEQGKSGLTQVEFCRRNGLAVSTFQRWRRRLEDVERSVEGEGGDAADFVELSVRPADTVVRNEGLELIFPSGLRLKILGGVEGRTLAEVLWALEAAEVC